MPAANLTGGLSKGTIIGIAVGVVVGALLLILLCVTCILKCVASSRADNPGRIVPNKKAMTPQHAQPFWEQNKLEVRPLLAPSNPEGVCLTSFAGT